MTFNFFVLHRQNLWLLFQSHCCAYFFARNWFPQRIAWTIYILTTRLTCPGERPVCVLFKRTIIIYRVVPAGAYFSARNRKTVHVVLCISLQAFAYNNGDNCALTVSAPFAGKFTHHWVLGSIFNYRLFLMFQYFNDRFNICFMLWAVTHVANIEHRIWGLQVFWPVVVNKLSTEVMNRLICWFSFI